MFYQIYKTTIKNILRSRTFWLALILLFAITIYNAVEGQYGYYDRQVRETIMDTDPRFILDYNTALKHVSNSCGALLGYTMPILISICTMVVLSRDYKDDFFEIEKSRGARPLSYLNARLTALLTINLAVITVAVILNYYWYIFSRGGIAGMETAEMFADTIVRLMRNIVVRGWTLVLFYVTFAYAVGNVFRSGLVGAVAGIGYAVAVLAASFFLSFRIDPFIFDYLIPWPNKLTFYLYYYDTEWFDGILESTGTDLTKAAICLFMLLGVSMLYYVISYFRIRKREI